MKLRRFRAVVPKCARYTCRGGRFEDDNLIRLDREVPLPRSVLATLELGSTTPTRRDFTFVEHDLPSVFLLKLYPILIRPETSAPEAPHPVRLVHYSMR